jgi:hypothetical protein
MMDRLREMYKESDGNGGWQVKCKNGQIETVGDSCAKVNPKMWKCRKEEDFSLKARRQKIPI